MRFRVAAGTFLVVFIVMFALPAFAQDQPKADWFLGYSYLHPNVKAGQGIPRGFGTALTFYPTAKLGLTADFGFHRKNGGSTTVPFMFGPRLNMGHEKARPFLEALFGGSHISSGGSSTTGFAMALGGGLDVKPWQHVGIRLFQVDYLLQRISGIMDNSSNGVRGQAGLVFYMGGAAVQKAMLGADCAASPTEVMAGEPVTVTGTPKNFNPKHTLTWNWNATGGKLSATTGTSPTVDTAGLAPGQYKVSGHVAGPKKDIADCGVMFAIKEPPKHPPTIACAAEHGTVMAGDPITINCTGASEDKRPLTYAWQSSAGTISGQRQNVTMASAGLVGPLTITTTAADDRGLTAQTTTNVVVQAPPPPPPPPAPAPGSAEAIKQDLQQKGKALIPVHFDTAKATIRPDSEELLTNAAQVLKDDPQMFIFVDGHTDSVGGKTMNLALSKRRAAAVRRWLMQHGIEGNRLVSRGYGMKNPVADNTTDEGRQANRRVELVAMSDTEKATIQTPKTPQKKTGQSTKAK